MIALKDVIVDYMEEIKRVIWLGRKRPFGVLSLDTLAVAATSPHFDRFELSRIPNKNLF